MAVSTTRLIADTENETFQTYDGDDEDSGGSLRFKSGDNSSSDGVTSISRLHFSTLKMHLRQPQESQVWTSRDAVP